MKDPETGQINHNFIETIAYSPTCKICNYSKSEHSDQVKEEKKEQDQELFGEHQATEKDNKDKIPNRSDNDIQHKKTVKHNKIEFAKELLDQYEEPNLCYICYTNKVDTVTAEKSDRCKHQFCIPCVKNHLTININNGKVNRAHITYKHLLFNRYWILSAFLVVVPNAIPKQK